MEFIPGIQSRSEHQCNMPCQQNNQQNLNIIIVNIGEAFDKI